MDGLFQKAISSSKITFSILLFMLFFPLFFHGYHVGLPWVKGGDEPHYLVMINSLISDGDLDIRNNYDSALKGSDQAGRKYAGSLIDRHAMITKAGKVIDVGEVWADPASWPIDPQGHAVPTLKKGVPPEDANLPEYSNHPMGIAFLLAPFLWFVRGTRFVEPLALFCSFMAIALSAFIFRRLVRRYNPDPSAVNAAVLITFLASPIWMNARTLFTEPFLLFFALASYCVFVENKSGFWPGVLIGLGGLLKPNFLMMVLPITVLLLRERKFKEILLLFLAPILSAFTFLYLNYRFLGSAFISPERIAFGDPLKESCYLLFSWNHGILCFSPIVLFCLFAWKRYFLNWRSDALLFGSGFLLYFVFMACITTGGWGWSFGPRHIIPVLPFLMIPMVYLWGDYSNLNKWAKMLVWVAIGVSVFINFFGALDGYWDSNPLTLLAGNVAP